MPARSAEAEPVQHAAPLHGLILAGGESRRMGSDKAAIAYRVRPQLNELWWTLNELCKRCVVSIRAAQSADPLRRQFATIEDVAGVAGPLAGILAALRHAPETAWLVVACDLPHVDATVLRRLIEARAPQRIATAYRAADGLPEPLCAIWEPASRPAIEQAAAAGRYSARAVLVAGDVAVLEPADVTQLRGADTPQESAAARQRIDGEAKR